ncbi:MAG: hypothetical protein H6735_17620 [Alphaproteobacteria bacterium]|nr:hypothetical protein [Alphaproteobacteria bacterium]
MHALLLSLSLARADEPGWTSLVDDPPQEMWNDGLVHRPGMAGGSATMTGTAVVGPVTPFFGQLDVGGGVRVPETPVVLGVTAQVVGAQLPTFDGTVVHGQSGGAEGWVSMRWKRWDHAVSLGAYTALADGSWYLRHPNETGPRLVGRYVGRLDGKRTDLNLEGRVGVGEAIPVEMATSVAVVTELKPWLAVSAGAEVGLVPFGIGMVGAHVRPVEQLEVGATLGVPFPLFSVGALEVQPALSAKAWF